MNQAPCADGPCTELPLEPETETIAWEAHAVSLASNRTPAGTQTHRLVRILVVEDDIFFRELNSEVLAHAGYTVDCVEDGAAAWDALKTSHYDLMVTDNSMPKVSGVELLRKLHGAGTVLPVIMATGAIPADYLSCQPTLQPVVMLLKPYAITELLRLVKNVLRETSPSLPAAA